MTDTNEKMIERQELMNEAMVHVNRCSNNIKLITAAIKAEDQDSLSMHAADAIVNLTQLCDLYSIGVLSMMFKKLSQVDRIDD